MPSVLSEDFPEGGRAAMVKLSGSSRSLILDSFIRLSSFFLARFSTCFLLTVVCRKQQETMRKNTWSRFCPTKLKIVTVTSF